MEASLYFKFDWSRSLIFRPQTMRGGFNWSLEKLASGFDKRFNDLMAFKANYVQTETVFNNLFLPSPKYPMLLHYLSFIFMYFVLLDMRGLSGLVSI